MKLSRKHLLVVPAIALALSVIPACSDDDDTDVDNPATTSLTGTTAVTVPTSDAATSAS